MNGIGKTWTHVGVTVQDVIVHTTIFIKDSLVRESVVVWDSVSGDNLLRSRATVTMPSCEPEQPSVSIRLGDLLPHLV